MKKQSRKMRDLAELVRSWLHPVREWLIRLGLVGGGGKRVLVHEILSIQVLLHLLLLLKTVYYPVK